MPYPEAGMTRRRFLTGLGGTVFGALLLGAEGRRESLAFQVSKHQRALRGLRAPLRLAVLTDFHMGPFLGERQLEGWVAASNALEPDAVVIVGDLVDRYYQGDLSEFRRWLPQLRSELGTFVVPGNHDYTRYRHLGPLPAMLHEAGARLLINDGVRLREDVFLAGVDDLLEGRPNARRALADAPAEDAAARVLLTHNPDVIPRLGDARPRDRVDLVLAGHTHGGQICIPGYGAVITSSAYGRRFASGWVRAAMPAFVSRGLGVTAVPFRFACPPEVVALELTPA